MSTKPFEVMARSFAEANPDGAARALERLAPNDAARVLLSLPVSLVGPVAEKLTPHAAGAILSCFTPEQTGNLLESMTPRQAVEVLHHVEEERRRAMLDRLPEESARQLRSLLVHPEDTAGGMMDPQVVSIPIDVSVGEAIGLLRRAPRQSLHYLYVTDRERRLLGVLGIRDLLLSLPRDRVEPMVRREVVSIAATMDREEVARIMQERDLLALPVVDEDRHLLGVVKHDEVLDAVQEEAFEDLQKMVGAGGDERVLAPVSHVVRRRLPWLAVNLLTALMASVVIAFFEDVIAKAAALAVLMPIVAGQGGNTGAQALSVVIRGLALREVMTGATWRILVKEMAAAFVSGAAIAVLTGSIVFLWLVLRGHEAASSYAVVIGLAMVVNMVVAGVAGAAIPLALHAVGWDPAQSSSIFLTTVTDVVGFAAFLGFAILLLPAL